MGNTGTVKTIATFTGTLLRRERAVGQKCVQLVFREDNENWLCLSTDLRHASLEVGKKYKVEGVFKKYGERPYINTPIIIPYKSAFRRFAPLGAVTSVLVIVAFAGLYTYAGKRHNNSHVLGTSATPNPAAYLTQTAGNTVAPNTPQTQAQTQTTPTATETTPTAPVKKPVNNNTTTTPMQPTPTPATQDPVVEAPVATEPVVTAPPVTDPPADGTNTPKDTTGGTSSTNDTAPQGSTQDTPQT